MSRISKTDFSFTPITETRLSLVPADVDMAPRTYRKRRASIQGGRPRPKMSRQSMRRRRNADVARPKTLHLGQNGKHVFPDRLVANFHIAYPISITSTSGAFSALAQVNLNNPHDLEGSGGTRQPRYWDTLVASANDSAGVYRKYRVLSAKVKLSGCSNDATVVGRLGFLAYPPTSTTPSTMEEIQERPFGSWCYVGTAASNQGIIYKSFTYDMAKLAGQTPGEYMGDDTYNGTGGSDPSALLAWKLYYQSGAASTSTFTGTLLVELEVECSTLSDVADS